MYMELTKLFAEVKTRKLFNTLKISDSETNSTYKIGNEGISIYGKPEILYKQIVLIQDTHELFCNGIFYNNTDELLKRISYDEQVISAALNEIVYEFNNSSTSTFKLGDTIYADGVYNNSVITFNENVKYDKNIDTIIINDEI